MTNTRKGVSSPTQAWLKRRARGLTRFIPQTKNIISLKARRVAAYFLVSAGALGIDFLAGGVLFASGLPIPISASVGYIAGLVIAFPLMRNWVFQSRNFSQSQEFLLFMSSGAIGVVMTWVFSFLGSELIGLGFTGAKLLAVFASFLSVFLFRYSVVFDRFSGVGRLPNKKRQSGP